MTTSAEFDEFDRDLDKIEDLIRFVINFRSFGAQASATVVFSDSDFVEAALELHRVSATIRTDLPILVGSLMLYACGRFEYFVGELVKAAADKEIEKASSYADLNKDIRASLRERLLLILADPGKYSYLKLSDKQLSTTLASILVADENKIPTDIPTQILASTDANMRPLILRDVLGRVGMKEVWADISKQAPLRTHFDATSEATCKVAATKFLEDLMSLRNSIAHPTASLAFPSPEQALSLCGSLRALSRAVSDVAQLPR